MSLWEPERWGRPGNTKMRLSEGQHAGRLIEAVEGWANSHPLHDQPVLDIGDEYSLTPDAIARALRDPHDRAHRLVVDLFEVGLSGFHGSQEEMLEQVIESFLGK